jgi:hypothetical protein
MNQIETLHVIRTQLEGRDGVLARNQELLEREREIVRREIDVVAELMGLEEQRVAAEVGPVGTTGPEADRAPVQAQVAPAIAAAPEPGQEHQPESLGASDPEPTSSLAAMSIETAADHEAAVRSEQELPAPAMTDFPPASAARAEPDRAEADHGQSVRSSAAFEPRDTEMLGRIEQLRRLRASLVVGSPAASSGRGD